MSKKSKVCAVPVCQNIVWSKGYCPAHYRKFRLYGYVPNIPVARISPKGVKPVCSVPDCTRLIHAKSLCHTHYTAELRSRGRV